MENERYLESKMVTNGFGSYLELTQKAYDFIAKPECSSIRIYESAEMREADEMKKSGLLVPSGSFKLVTQTQ